MTKKRAITNGPNEKLCGKEVEIHDGKITECPGCTTTQIPVVKNEEFGLTFIGYHDMPPIIGNTKVHCDYSGEVLKLLTEIQPQEEAGVSQ